MTSIVSSWPFALVATRGCYHIQMQTPPHILPHKEVSRQGANHHHLPGKVKTLPAVNSFVVLSSCRPAPNLALQCVTSQASHVLSSTGSGRPNHCQPPCYLLHHSCLRPLHPLQVPCIYIQAVACRLSEYEFSVAESATLLASPDDHGWGSPFKPCCGQSGLCSDCRWSWLLVATEGATV